MTKSRRVAEAMSMRAQWSTGNSRTAVAQVGKRGIWARSLSDLRRDEARYSKPGLWPKRMACWADSGILFWMAARIWCSEAW